MLAEARLTGISNVSPQEWRKNGGYDLMSKARAKKINAILLGLGNYYGFNQFFLRTLKKAGLRQ